MKLSHMALVCVAVSAPMLSGCVPQPTKVKDVLTDKTGYLSANFSPDTISPKVRSKIQANDGTSLGFHKMKIGLTWTFNTDDKNKTTTGQKMTTFINAGGSFVEMLSEYSKNDITYKQEYDLSYRGLLTLKTQYVSDSSTFAGVSYEVKDMLQLDSLSAAHAAQAITYKYKYGTKVQIMNFRDGSMTCTVGESYPASKAFTRLGGNARNIDCTNYNNNGVEQGKAGHVYLEKYGIAVLTSTKSASAISDAKIDSVEIE